MGKVKDVANRTVQAVRLDSSLLMVKTIAILIDNFFSSQGKMSQEHDSSDEGSIEGSVPVPDNGQIGEKRGRPLGKKKRDPPATHRFVLLAHQPLRAGGLSSVMLRRRRSTGR